MVNPDFGLVPAGIPGTPVPFTLHIPNHDIHQLRTLVQHAPLDPPSFYNTHNYTDGADFAFGASRDYIAEAAHTWLHDYDWRAHEARWNAVPQFTINVTAPSDGQVFNFHFGALFSQREDAVPVLLSHGWPSGWHDFVGVLELLAEKYTPKTLPYHVIAPSIPDYGPSTRDGLLETELDYYKAAEALNELMKSLGFNAYVAQGGDVGTAITAALGAKHDEVKAVLFNNLLLRPSEIASVADLPVTPEESTSLAASTVFAYSGTGYMFEHGTKPSTIALVLGSSPVALLSWIGGLLSEAAPTPIDFILTQVSWYWYTKSFSRSLWSYRSVWEGVLKDVAGKLPSPLAITNKPVGYSYFPQEVLPAARSWLEHWFGENLVQYHAHEKGGHFAAFEEPEAFLKDVEDFVAIVKTKVEF
ncbi:putative epoxide hydrolase [Dichotomopilus funicola]|uniref:Epoxide hydrolase n=1 Tax=Dichotomopilus funicola TaxID=1934379 RepID=A0AAN6UZW4_9PEZI|nr:putative epoxide hydrolase [Dichotomopilus funicola]